MKDENFSKYSYYEGPRKNQYEGWSENDIKKDLEKALKNDEKLKSWDGALINN